jgi:hypothetical protein
MMKYDLTQLSLTPRRLWRPPSTENQFSDTVTNSPSLDRLPWSSSNFTSFQDATQNQLSYLRNTKQAHIGISLYLPIRYDFGWDIAHAILRSCSRYADNWP